MTTWNDQMSARLRELWPTGVYAYKIAEELGVSQGTISARAARLGLPARHTRYSQRSPGTVASVVVGNREYVRQSAASRGLSENGLIQRIVTTVIAERMVDAVLDDAR